MTLNLSNVGNISSQQMYQIGIVEAGQGLRARLGLSGLSTGQVDHYIKMENSAKPLFGRMGQVLTKLMKLVR